MTWTLPALLLHASGPDVSFHRSSPPYFDGNQWIDTEREKTLIPVKVPILPKAAIIIKKYKGDPWAVAQGTLFPVISNQKLNSYLKEVADLCGIKKHLTFHLAKQTYLCHLGNPLQWGSHWNCQQDAWTYHHSYNPDLCKGYWTEG